MEQTTMETSSVGIPSETANSVDWVQALEKATQSLVAVQQLDGAWEGEVVWCPMLPAQYVLMCYITQTPISHKQRQSILKQFEVTRLSGSGLWGLHDKSHPYLFVTTLVYVAARLLDVAKSDPLIEPAWRFIQAERGALAIPSWGKFWLAMLNLYDWQGVNPVLPEVWLLPEWLPIHPSNFYCHTRLIYMPMGLIYGKRFQVTLTPLLRTLRTELYPSPYEQINFRAARSLLRPEDTYNPPSRLLKLAYHLTELYERWYRPVWRKRAISRMVASIRYELQTTQYTSLSPVSGLLNMIALWLHDPDDPDFSRAQQEFQGWLWQDDEAGLRVSGARSSTWDTSFAIQALQEASSHVEVSADIQQAQRFLATQQIRTAFPKAALTVPGAMSHRINPQGGFCFAGVWHGWPVSDCTAEAVLALLDAPVEIKQSCNLQQGMDFILRCQNADGGFGSYEHRKTASTLEWLNPAEMFANSMTEHSYVECTASCLIALQAFQQHDLTYQTAELTTARHQAGRWLCQQQQADGSWPGFWGVNFIYGTLFGIYGLLATENSDYVPAIQKACQWLVSKQRPDGGWGEHFQGCLSGEYVEHTESQVTQTAWALMALLKANVQADQTITKGVNFLIERQLDTGNWPKQDMSGLFFQTALLDYTLYRSYFPLWAIALYASKQKNQLGQSNSS